MGASREKGYEKIPPYASLRAGRLASLRAPRSSDSARLRLAARGFPPLAALARSGSTNWRSQVCG
jgi:hypothetical protein